MGSYKQTLNHSLSSDDEKARELILLQQTPLKHVWLKNSLTLSEVMKGLVMSLVMKRLLFSSDCVNVEHSTR